MKEFWLYRFGAPFAEKLPEKLVYWMALRVADQCYRRDHKGRKGIASNLRRIFEAKGVIASEAVIQGYSRKLYQYFGKNIVDFFRLSSLVPDRLRHRISTENEETFKACCEEGNGVIVVAAHLGNWELGGGMLASLCSRFNAVTLPHREGAIYSMYQRQRERYGVHPIPLGRSAVGLVRCLHRGEAIALLADRDFTRRGTEVELFGAPARLPMGPAWLSLKTGATIVPAFALRLVDDSFLLRIHDPIRPDQEGSVEAIQQKICASLEREIGESPYQWFIFDDFWAPQAEGET